MRFFLTDFCSFLMGGLLAPKARAFRFGYGLAAFASRVKGMA